MKNLRTSVYVQLFETKLPVLFANAFNKVRRLDSFDGLEESLYRLMNVLDQQCLNFDKHGDHFSRIYLSTILILGHMISIQHGQLLLEYLIHLHLVKIFFSIQLFSNKYITSTHHTTLHPFILGSNPFYRRTITSNNR